MTSKRHHVIRLAIAVIAVGCGSAQAREAPGPRAAGPTVAGSTAAGPAAAGPAAAGDAKAQLAGAWAGKLEIPGQPLDIELMFAPDGTGTIDIPAQGASGLALSQIAVSGTAVTFELVQVGATFHGVLQGAVIAGTMTQSGQSFPFSLARRGAVVKDAYTPPPAAPSPTAASGAPLIGAWRGFVEQASGKTALVVELSSQGGAGATLVGSAALGDGCARVRPLGGLAFTAPRVHFALTPGKAPAAYFDGELAGTTITGTLHQGGTARRFSLTRVAPAAPPPYRESEVGFASSGNTRLAGTLTVPSRAAAGPAVVLVTGSGPQDRDECVFGVRPFRQLADYLARHGIASLRYDDRGTASSTGEFATATAVELADDAEAAVRFLVGRPEIDARRIGVLGHSEGGMIAPIVATRTRSVAFIVLWAGPGLAMPVVELQQTEDMMRAERAPANKIAREVKLETEVITALRAAHSERELSSSLRAAVERALSPADLRELGDVAGWVDAKVKETWTPWLRWYLDYDPATTLAKVACPVLAVNGGMDMQVAAKPNLRAIRGALAKAGNPDFDIIELAGLNHLFQPTRTGAVSEYGKNPPVLDSAVLEATTRWIQKHTMDPEH
jgi:uncharacterized protein